MVSLARNGGVRRYQNPDGSLTPAGKRRYGSVEVANAHAAYKSANKQYSKSYHDYYKTGRKLSSLLTKKGRADYDAKTKKMLSDADEVARTRSEYKSAKNEASRQKKYDIAEAKAYKAVSEINRGTALLKARDKVDDAYSTAEKIIFNNHTRDKAAKFVVDNNMTVSEAKKKANKEAVRNTATILLAVGAISMMKPSTPAINSNPTAKAAMDYTNDIFRYRK